MAINLEINQAQIDDPKAGDISVHYMPASIKGDGPAKVDTFFTPYSVNEDGMLKNTFRGHPLQGCKFQIPDPYKGLIFQETDCPLDENAKRVFKFAGVFDEMNYWNYDKVPSKADPFRQMWDVTCIAETMCADISLSDIEKKMEEKANKNTES